MNTYMVIPVPDLELVLKDAEGRCVGQPPQRVGHIRPTQEIRGGLKVPREEEEEEDRLGSVSGSWRGSLCWQLRATACNCDGAAKHSLSCGNQARSRADNQPNKYLVRDEPGAGRQLSVSRSSVSGGVTTTVMSHCQTTPEETLRVTDAGATVTV